MLKVTYAFFIGILLAIFVGVGVSAFYQEPKVPEYPKLLNTVHDGGPTKQQQSAQRGYDKKYSQYSKDLDTYNRNVSIITLIAATAFVGASLRMPNRLQVIADGVMLGGIFTLIYSIGRSFAASDTRYTFVVVTIGLIIAVTLGYIRFIKPEELSVASKKSKK